MYVHKLWSIFSIDQATNLTWPNRKQQKFWSTKGLSDNLMQFLTKTKSFIVAWKKKKKMLIHTLNFIKNKKWG